MKLLKNKKFWAITLGVTLVGAGVVAVAASCSSSNVKSKLSSQLVKSKDEKSFYAVYDIENFDDLNENDKKALNEAEFNVAITSAENKTENATTKGHLLNKKIYVKLPREPKAKEQLTIINKGGLLKTASLVLPDNLNYQTEKVEFETQPGNGTTSPEKPGNGTTSPEKPGNGTTSPEKPGNGTTSPEKPGNGTTSPEKPGNGTTSPEKPRQWYNKP
ncbi:MBA family surface membrane protein, partial [Ureaplasma urealyticum]|uniref:MBA family surface membrane protein n=1 Tax=Ureaplasma urealyticum TaxID=2130 RepID=UPI0003610E70